MFGFIKNRAANKRRKQASRKQQQARLQWRWERRFALPGAMAVIVLAAMLLLPRGEFLPIEKIRIVGEFSELDTTRIEQDLRPHLGKGFFAINIEHIQMLVLSRPWVRSVSVKRVWPNELAVQIVEKKALARWNDEQLLSRAGRVFVASGKKFNGLPLVNGYEGQSHEVLKRYADLQKRLVGRGIELREYREDSKGSLTLILNSGLKLSLGSDQLERKLDQLLAVYDTQIRGRGETIQHIDFRYSNGFAVAWKPEYLNQHGEMPRRGDKNV